MMIMTMIVVLCVVSFLLLLVLLLFIRIYIVSCTIRSNRQRSKQLAEQLLQHQHESSSVAQPATTTNSFIGLHDRQPHKPLRTLIVLGSGGHTSEILYMTQYLNEYMSSSTSATTTTSTSNSTSIGANVSTTNNTSLNGQQQGQHKLFDPIYYCKASTDTTSQDRLYHTIQNRDMKYNPPDGTKTSTTVQLYSIPRSREVGQSYISSVYTTIVALLYSLKLLYRLRPNVLICNGPGTCIPLCIILTLYRICNIVPNNNTYIVFIESFCRVQSLSLSGKLLYYLYLLPSDVFILHWKELYHLYPNGTIVTNTYINE